MTRRLLTNEGVLHRDSLAKYFAAFFRISFSSLSRAFSRFNCSSSAIVEWSQFNGQSERGYDVPRGTVRCQENPIQRYSSAFKLEATRLAEESDTPVSQVARQLGIRVNQIYKWKQRLGRELALAREETAILKKAAAYFAKEST